MKYFKKNRGITLIALVITIIVMLILVGVTLSMISGENGILGKAEKAVDETSSASMKEDVEFTVFNLMADYYSDHLGEGDPMDYVKAQCASTVKTQAGADLMYNNSTGKFEYTNDGKMTELTINQNGRVELGDATDVNEEESTPGFSTAGMEMTSQNRTLANATTGYSYKNPVIPQGFKAVNVGSATWEYTDSTTVSGWNEGLVIQDASNGNQFVWVPVDGTNVTYAKWCTKNIAYNNSSISDDTSAMPSGVTDKTTTYGGFYVARFEAGYASGNNSDSNNTGTVAPVSTLGTKVWNYINYTSAATASKQMVNNTSTYGNNKSGLITGTQWDTIMKWYDKSGIKTGDSDGTTSGNQDWGSYRDLSYSGNGNYFLYTGSVKAWTSGAFSHTATTSSASSSNPYHYTGTGLNSSAIKKNIADLGGNVWEWSAEIYLSDRVLRGASADGTESEAPASYRGSITPSISDYNIGFRSVLYIQ